MIGLGPYVAYFLLASLTVAIVTAAIHLEEIPQIVIEAFRFFVTIVIGIGIFACIVGVLEWIFIRSLI